MTSAMPVQCSTNWAIKLTGSWSYCEFVIYPWRLSYYIHIQNKDEQAVKLSTTGGASVGLLIACVASVSVGFCVFSLFDRAELRSRPHGQTAKNEQKSWETIATQASLFYWWQPMREPNTLAWFQTLSLHLHSQANVLLKYWRSRICKKGISTLRFRRPMVGRELRRGTRHFFILTSPS